jgi:hypothetical protein
MGQPVARNGVGQRAHHRLLPDQFGEGLRAVLAGQHAIGLAACRRAGGGQWRRRGGCGFRCRYGGQRQARGIAEQRILPRRLKLGSGRAGASSSPSGSSGSESLMQQR